MVSFSLETQISLSKAIERDFDTQSMSCLPFFLPPGSFERLNAKKLHQLLLVSSSASKQQGSGILLPKGGEDYGSWGKMGNSKSKIFPLFFQHNTHFTNMETPSSSQFKKMFVTALCTTGKISPKCSKAKFPLQLGLGT